MLGARKPIPTPPNEGFMHRLLKLAAAAVFVVAPLAARAQAAPPPSPTTPGSVMRVVLIRFKPGQAPAFWRDVQQHLKPVYDEEKRAGILLDYSFATKSTSASENDWNVALVLTYPNWASLDNLGQRTDPITLKHYGSADARTAAATKRSEYGTTVETFLMREQRINDVAR
jgi:hypothetical protein